MSGLALLLDFLCPPNFRTVPLNKPSSSSQTVIHIHLPRQYFKTRVGELASPNILRMGYFS